MTGRIVVVTGTDTGVGKTLVTAALGRCLRDRGVRVVAVKPVESGVDGSEGEDGHLLAEATGQGSPREALDRLKVPVAPPEAAEMEGLTLEPQRWLSAIRELSLEHEVVLVEGAGSLLSPLTWETSLLDLAQDLNATAVVVGLDRLGVQGHTLLTIRALRDAGRDTLAVVLNAPEKPDASTETNGRALTRVDPSIQIISVPRVGHWTEAVSHLAPLAEELRP
ncbi:MAG: dethiobiotin synthase [Myxococcota bacterium]|nr:dethiobiotin synthase [Myxococcota bacterium]MEE2780265.1 dethiobiotin synthase [Myxococcota bacterium]